MDALSPLLLSRPVASSSWVDLGGGWLSNLGSLTGWTPGLGVKGFAEGAVVHTYSGLATLSILLTIGPILRRVVPNGETRSEYIYMRYVQKVDFQGIDLPLAILGTVLLWFGWHGFNCCSTATLSVQTGYAVANTAIAASLGGVVATSLSKLFEGSWGPVMSISGILGGLTAITPLAGFINLYASFFVGVVAGLVTYYGYKAC